MNAQELYKLIIGQLRRDGFSDIADTVTQTLSLDPSLVPSDRLHQLVNKGLEIEQLHAASRSDSGNNSSHDKVHPCLDFSTVIDNARSRTQNNYALVFAGVQKSSSPKTVFRVANFSSNGAVVAVGASDGCIQVLDVSSMERSGDITGNDTSPNMCLITEHSQSINDVKFHPNGDILASASKDKMIKFFDFKRAAVSKSTCAITESHNVRSISIHPSGDYMLVGGDHPTVRIYDINQLKCFASPQTMNYHIAPITQVSYSEDGRHYASACKVCLPRYLMNPCHTI